jgi:hypothetical protein
MTIVDTGLTLCLNMTMTRLQVKTYLTTEQLKALSLCAKGISLRFDEPAIVDALVAGGYITKNVAGVFNISAEGLRYLQICAG